jgi:hypothetical protein
VIQSVVASKKRILVRGWTTIEHTTTLRYHCPEGHTHTQDVCKPDKHGRYQIAPALFQKFATYWSKEHGGVSFYCPQCTAQYRKSKQGK